MNHLRRRRRVCSSFLTGSMPLRVQLVVSTLILLTGVAEAQILPGFTLSKQWTIDRIGENHWRLTGAVEIERQDMKFYADEIEVFTDTNRLIGKGNVVYASGGSRIAADRMEFDTETRLGTFFNATGSASLGERVERSMFGTQEPDAYFYGKTLEKIGPKRYRITEGGFTTCLQPTPRWELTSTTVTINLDDYAILTNPVLRVKGVPLFYLPVIYYPMTDEDRATGFLIPTYGNSSYRGQSLSNAFFWAINRSQDATVFHDWFTKTGQGAGLEYRYIAAPGSEGTARAYWLSEKSAAFDSGAVVPGRRSYELRANATQALPGRMRMRGYVDYFSDIATQQLYHQNIYDASRRSRAYGTNVSGGWGGYSLNGTFDVRELFYGATDSTLYGSAPKVALTVAPKSIAGTPIYFTLNSEYARVLREDRTSAGSFPTGLTRFDMSPAIQVPFTRWPFLTIRSSAAWHGTHYSDSQLEGVRVPDAIFRRYYDLRTELVGPSFVRIWDTPANRYAERYKHVVEPFLTIQRISPIENAERVVALEGTDYTVGDMTRLQYGITNRFLARRNEQGRTTAREFLTVGIHQTYYTDALASQVDYSYSTSFRGRPPSNYSPILINTRAQLTDQLDGSLRLEYDPIVGGFQSIGANGTIATSELVRTQVGWSKRRLRDQFELDNFINADTSVRSRSNRVGGIYAFNYDLARHDFLQQRFVGYYNAQCCGIAMEYQAYSYPTGSTFQYPISRDRRFNISFTLAGIGTFANLLGAFGGAPGR